MPPSAIAYPLHSCGSVAVAEFSRWFSGQARKLKQVRGPHVYKSIYLSLSLSLSLPAPTRPPMHQFPHAWNAPRSASHTVIARSVCAVFLSVLTHGAPHAGGAGHALKPASGSDKRAACKPIEAGAAWRDSVRCVRVCLLVLRPRKVPGERVVLAACGACLRSGLSVAAVRGAVV